MKCLYVLCVFSVTVLARTSYLNQMSFRGRGGGGFRGRGGRGRNVKLNTIVYYKQHLVSIGLEFFNIFIYLFNHINDIITMLV